MKNTMKRKKLQLKAITIQNLDNEQQNGVRAGESPGYYSRKMSCDDYCETDIYPCPTAIC